MGLYYSQARSCRTSGSSVFMDIEQGGSHGRNQTAVPASRRQKGGNLRPRLGQEPGRGGQDLHLRADERYGSPLRGQGHDRYRSLPGGGQGLVQEAPRVPEDVGRRQEGALRHHRLLEVGPPQPGHVPRRRPHGGHRGVPHQPGGRHGCHRHEDLRSDGGHRQDRAGQLPREGVDGQEGNSQAGAHTRQQRPLRLPHRRRRQATDSGGRG